VKKGTTVKKGTVVEQGPVAAQTKQPWDIDQYRSRTNVVEHGTALK
jgi:hypothetical protein